VLSILVRGGIDELDTRRLWKEFFQYAITMLFISHDIISYNIISFFVEKAADEKLTIQGTSGCAVYSEVVILVNLPGGKEGYVCQAFLKLDKSAIFCASSLVPHKRGLIFFYAVEIGKEISLFSIPTATATT